MMSPTSSLIGLENSEDDCDPQLNADFKLPLAVDTGSLVWQGSPAEGVYRKRLELIGEDRPQLTTLVQFGSGSEFPQHIHDGGEEFLVLSGVFSDETGDYGRGCYVRNPPGSHHAPYTLPGCLLLVKLRQFQDGDIGRVVMQTRGTAGYRYPTEGINCDYLELHRFGHERVRYYRLGSDGFLKENTFRAGVEIYVIKGSVQVGSDLFTAGYWLRFPPDSRLGFRSTEGAELLVKEGPVRHL